MIRMTRIAPPGEQQVPISASAPDWSREYKRSFDWAPGKSLLASIRAYQRHDGSRSPLSPVLKRIAVLRHRFWSVVTGADIPLNCRIGGGLQIPHPNGVVIHPDAEIGPNCLLFQQVTIGQAHGGVPTVGGHVDFGAGAKVLGRITIGDHALIGANSVVLRDVRPGATAVGVPARCILVPAAPLEALHGSAQHADDILAAGASGYRETA
jgi:serine O-acetyltransferase